MDLPVRGQIRLMLLSFAAAFAAAGNCRCELGIATTPKLYGATAATKACHMSLNALDTEYIDLYMMHWPGLQDPSHGKVVEAQGYGKDIRRESWLALESMVMNEPAVAREISSQKRESETTVMGSGSYRVLHSIGVCNFLPKHLEELAGYCSIPPAVIQYECHPLLGAEGTENPLRRLCTRLFPMKPIHFQAHSALAGGSAQLLGNEELKELAVNIRRTVAQIAIRWSLQKGNSK
ncbi:unnamed protein product [Echinostoma caproni]|uniref:Aldo_ket_red domain-containing protein n=1 Tax=Echinostoma caproni TaxID=27848 RepID=A0A183B198_9TREM|nr:unnamed protein product [Echinostoma caproni]